MADYETIYRCEYEVEVIGWWSGQRTVRSRKGISDFKDGFWVNSEFQLTKGSDARYWIPPNAIKYIAKDRVLKHG